MGSPTQRMLRPTWKPQRISFLLDPKVDGSSVDQTPTAKAILALSTPTAKTLVVPLVTSLSNSTALCTFRQCLFKCRENISSNAKTTVNRNENLKAEIECLYVFPLPSIYKRLPNLIFYNLF